MKYCIIGNGRVARHFAHYFTLLQLPFAHWYRNCEVALEKKLEGCTHVLVLISDDSIENFIIENSANLDGKTIVHFSAAVQSQYAYSAHPLQTFNDKLESLEFYQQIPFAFFTKEKSFAELLPKITNKHTFIDITKKSYYHAMCVMANNFTTILWQKFFKEMQSLGVAEEDCVPILQQTFKNLQNDYKNSLTGPLKRGDKDTINKNLQSLEDDDFYDVYKSFIKAYTKVDDVK